MSNNNKIKFPLWVKPKTMETVKQMYKDDNCRSQSEFIEKAVNAYIGYLQAKNSSGMLPNYMISTLKAIVADEKNLALLRNSCIDEVRKINGMLKFEDAYHWQND